MFNSMTLVKSEYNRSNKFPNPVSSFFSRVKTQICRPCQTDCMQGRRQRGRQREAYPRTQRGDSEASRAAQGRGHRSAGR